MGREHVLANPEIVSECPMNMVRMAAVGLAWLTLVPIASAQNPGETSTQVFGVTGKGTSFVYVFDRSLSMEGAPLAAAKRELLASLSHLQRVHQFQVIFYNEKPKMMPVPQMLFADENGVQQAQSFVNTITASGGTDHLLALQMAMKLRPDVIFLLTDADEPPLTAKQLAEVRQNNTAIINIIEFKSPPVGKSPPASAAKRSFLRQLAEENRGEYKSIDMTSLPAKK